MPIRTSIFLVAALGLLAIGYAWGRAQTPSPAEEPAQPTAASRAAGPLADALALREAEAAPVMPVLDMAAPVRPSSAPRELPPPPRLRPASIQPREVPKPLRTERSPAMEESANPQFVIEMGMADAELSSLLESARQALAVGDVDTALYFYRSALRDAPGHRDALMGYAAAVRAHGEPDAALAAYRQVLAADPQYVPAAQQIAGLTAAADPRSARMALDRLSRLHPDDPSILAQLALLMERSGERDGALRSLRRAVELAPNEPVYRLNLALALDRAGRGAAALPHYRSVLEAAYRGASVPADMDAVEARYRYLANRPR